MNKTVNPNELTSEDDGPLYAARKKVYPQSVSGTFRRIKWGLMAFCLGVYYFLPFFFSLSLYWTLLRESGAQAPADPGSDN